MIIHGGIPRAASTFLQDVVFPRLTVYRYERDLSRRLADLGFDDLEFVDADRLSALTLIRDEKVVLSREGFYGSYHHSFARDTGARQFRCELALLNAKRLFGSGLKLLMIIRRQEDVIESMIQYKRRFLTDPDMFIADFPPATDLFGAFVMKSQYGRLLQSYDYYVSISAARSILGPDNVVVIPYEDLADAPQRFFAGLSKVFDEDLSHLRPLAADVRNAKSPKYIGLGEGYVPMSPVVRKLNNLSGHRLERILPRRAKALTGRRREQIRAIFRDSNRKLAQLIDVDLAKHAYY